MKIALIPLIACAAAIFSGCSTNQGGTADEYNTSNGAMHSSGTTEQTGPSITDPSLPLDPGAGPAIPPP